MAEKQFEQIDTILTLCRLCLKTTISSSDYPLNASLISTIDYCFGQEVLIATNESIKLSQSICRLCFDRLSTFSVFKKQCFYAQEKLKEHLQLTKNTNKDLKVDESSIKKQNRIRIVKVNKQKINKDVFVCKTCNKSFSYASTLRTHEKSHTGDKPILCTICGKKFARTGHLTVHMRSHSEEKPYVCHICAKSFYQNCDLNVHMRKHTGDKSYRCKTCEKLFRTSSALYKHEKTHLDKQPFPCSICGKSFSDAYGVQRHESNVHNKY